MLTLYLAIIEKIGEKNTFPEKWDQMQVNYHNLEKNYFLHPYSGGYNLLPYGNIAENWFKNKQAFLKEERTWNRFWLFHLEKLGYRSQYMFLDWPGSISSDRFSMEDLHCISVLSYFCVRQ